MVYPKHIFKVIFLVFILFGFSCSKEKEGDAMPVSGIHTYYPRNIVVSKAVDINMDGQYNTNLFLEMASLKDDPLMIDFDKKRIKIFWQEPRIDNLPLGVLPNQYSEDMLLRFYPVKNTYLYRITDEGVFRPYQGVENDLNRTFIFPQYIYIDETGRLKFKAQQKALTSEGIIYLDIEGVYELKK